VIKRFNFRYIFAFVNICAAHRSAELQGIRFVVKDGDRVVVSDPTAPSLWARYYDLKTNKPVFMGRDSIPREHVSQIELERRVGYAWYGEWGKPVLAAYEKWSRENPAR
jgi:PelA/Pel-15E family pectate lyase